MSSQLAAPSIEPDIQALVPFLAELRICNYIILSALIFILYDIVINLEREVLLVWGYRQNNDLVRPLRRVKQVLVHVLFVFSRYYGLVFLAAMFAVNNTTGLSVMFCKRYYYYNILAGTVLYVTTVNVILAMRINALYGGNQCCGVFLGSLIVGEFLVEVSICAVMAVHSTAAIVSAPPWWPGCMMSSRITPVLTLASWLTALFVSTIFCVMTVKNILFDKLALKDMLRSSLHPRTRVLLCDGVTFYFLIFFILLVSTIVLTVVQNEFSVFPVSLLVAIYSYSASRLILNIRAVEHNLRPPDVPDNPDSLPPIPFLTLPEPEEQPVASSSRV